MKLIDYFLDRITMYRLVLYFLIVLIVAAIALSWTDVIHFSAVGIAFSAIYLTLICWITNKIFAWAFSTPSNTESAFITALILSLIINPYRSHHDLVFLTAAGGLAMASKYILAIKKKHIFNPAAIAVVLLAFGPRLSANWWVGTTALLPIVVIGGLLIIRKIDREAMVMVFILAVLGSTIIIDLFTHHSIGADLQRTLLHSSLFFLAFIMLTEPLTSPTTNDMRLWYGALVGVLFSPQIHIGSLYSTPELTLIAGNIFTYLVSPKYKLLPKLKQKIKLTPDIVDFIFTPERAINYQPGQYMEWTIGHDKVDSRGNRRYLTLASSPTENEMRVGVKFYPRGSSYKKALLKMPLNSTIAAGHLGGDFVMPKNQKQKLAFIAGGIGITPYRSMIKYLLDKKEERDIALFYGEKNHTEFVYKDIFDQAAHQLGAKIIYTITEPGIAKSGWTGPIGTITGDMIKSNLEDYKDRIFYVSGPHGMVRSVEEILKDLGIPRRQIKTDLFPGYA
jgi:ferredoxin-NADP reductase/Na+-translocating ferredoxin:NAD+ oxidoreductase RnfD subunit